jgi:hypothetical protein
MKQDPFRPGLPHLLLARAYLVLPWRLRSYDSEETVAAVTDALTGLIDEVAAMAPASQASMLTVFNRLLSPSSAFVTKHGPEAVSQLMHRMRCHFSQ